MAIDGAYRPVTPFDHPLAPDEGKINLVETDYAREYSGAGVEYSCCECAEPILLTDEHVRARGLVWSEYGHRARASHFCDREGWASWASR